LIKYIKSFLWRAAKYLSYIEDARCLKVNITRNTEAANKETRLALNVNKIKPYLEIRMQHEVTVKRFIIVPWKVLKSSSVTILKNQNSIQEEIKSRLKSSNACYHLVQNLLYFTFLSKNIKIKLCRIIIFIVVVYRRETWWLILREERRLSVLENGVLRRIFGPKRNEVTGEWRKLHIKELNDLYSSPNIIRVIKLRRKR